MSAALLPCDTPTSPALHQRDQDAEISATSPKSSQNIINFVATWQGKKFPLQLDADQTVISLKGSLFDVTRVPAERQKLVGLVKGKLPDDSAVLSTLSLKPKKLSDTSIEFLMMGTPDESLFKDQTDLPDIVNDLDYDYEMGEKESILIMNDAKVKKRLNEVIAKVPINIINPLREGKKLLVLDLDYTLFDCKSPATHINQLMRPGMHSFLTTTYEHYDIVIWSQTKWRYLEAKLTELGILSHDQYKLAFVMDISSMISITTRKADGQPYKHQVKPLDFIWAKFPGRWSASNTIHVDDLSRNFALNPGEGLKISAFRDAHIMSLTDRELYFVARYLVLICGEEDFRLLDHKRWRSYPGVQEY